MTSPKAISIDVQVHYSPDKSDPEKDRYAFSYRITIHNDNGETVKLIRRYWTITDANGKQIKLQGDGVVGQQPEILSGKQFNYTSSVVLDTPVGVMQGHYLMSAASGVEFEVPITPFRLALPNIVH